MIIAEIALFYYYLFREGSNFFYFSYIFCKIFIVLVVVTVDFSPLSGLTIITSVFEMGSNSALVLLVCFI